MAQTWQTKLQSSLEKLSETYQQQDQLRDEIIKDSRDIIKPSKKAIYAVHKGDYDTAKELLSQARKHISSCQERVKEHNLPPVGALKAGREEYVEAVCFLQAMQTKSLPSFEECNAQVDIPLESYVGGLADCTGELSRQAILQATQGNEDFVRFVYETIQALYGMLLEFDFRSGELRKKFDSIKYHLTKVENILYDQKVKAQK